MEPLRRTTKKNIRFEGDEGENCLTRQLISRTNDGSLGHARVQDERGFDLRSRQAMARDVDDICDVLG